MGSLILPRRWRDRLLAHAAARAPEECCGVVLASADGGRRVVRIVRIVRARNVDPGDRRRRYSIAPRALLAAHKAARGRDLCVLGYYHSHPERPPVPSVTDRAHAVPDACYLIAGRTSGEPFSIRAWHFTAGDFTECPLITPDEPHDDHDA